jgi:hypothetical protein
VIIKLANIKQMIRPLQRHAKHFVSATGSGAAMGAIVGLRTGAVIDGFAKYDYKKKKWPKSAILKSTAIGAGIGALAGFGYNLKNVKSYEKSKFDWMKHERSRRNWQRSGTYTPPSSKGSMSDVEQFFKKYHTGHSGVTSKAQAKKIYRTHAQRLHPDVNPGKSAEEEMQKLNGHWDKVRNTDWFEKLAMIIRRSFKNAH